MNRSIKQSFIKTLALSLAVGSMAFVTTSMVSTAQAETNSSPYASPFDKPYQRVPVAKRDNQPFNPIVADRTVQYSVYFESNETDLTPDQFTSFDSLFNLLNTQGIKSIYVIGHTDSTGSVATNRIVGKKRATSVAAYLSSKGIDKDILHVVSDGEKRPSALNSSYLGKSENRRVDVLVIF